MQRDEVFDSIVGNFRMTPDAEERFSKQILAHIKGTVRLGSSVFFIYFIAAMLAGGFIYEVYHFVPGLIRMLLLIGYLGVMAFSAWYLFSWRIDFDASTEFVHYHTLLRGTDTYHVSELMRFEVTGDVWQTRFKQTRVRFLAIHLNDTEKLTIPLATSWAKQMPLSFGGIGGSRVGSSNGFPGADKLYTYLDLYRRYVFEKGYSQNAAEVLSVPGANGLTPAVQRAIAEQQQWETFPETPQKPRPEAAVPAPSKPEIPELSSGKVSLKKPFSEDEPKARPVMPERGNAFPDPARSAFPDPARKPRADVDVDALFNQVLREHGKLK